MLSGAMIRPEFASIDEVSYLTIPREPKRRGVLKLYLASGHHPLPRTKAFAATYDDRVEKQSPGPRASDLRMLSLMQPRH